MNQWIPISEDNTGMLGTGKSEQTHIDAFLNRGNMIRNEMNLAGAPASEAEGAYVHPHYQLIKYFSGHGPIGNAVRTQLSAAKYLNSLAPKKTIDIGDERPAVVVDNTVDKQYEQFLKDFSLYGKESDWVTLINDLPVRGSGYKNTPVDNYGNGVIIHIIDRYMDCAVQLPDGTHASIGLEGLGLYPADFKGMGMQCVTGEKVWYMHNKEGMRYQTDEFVLSGDRERYYHMLHQTRRAVFDRFVQEYQKVTDSSLEEQYRLSHDIIIASCRSIVECLNMGAESIYALNGISSSPFMLNVSMKSLNKAYKTQSAGLRVFSNRKHNSIQWREYMSLYVIPEIQDGKVSYRLGNVFVYIDYYNYNTSKFIRIPLYRDPAMPANLSFDMASVFSDTSGRPYSLPGTEWDDQFLHDLTTAAIVMDHDFLAGVAAQAAHDALGDDTIKASLDGGPRSRMEEQRRFHVHSASAKYMESFDLIPKK